MNFVRSFLHDLKHRRKPVRRGFTLIEMIVVLAIITIITAIILVSQTTFNHTLLLTDTAYTVALSVRETQTLGLSSEAFNGVQNAGYGVHFAAAPASSYLQFIDSSPGVPTNVPLWCPAGTVGTPNAKPGNCIYDGSSRDGLVRTYAFNQAFTEQFCAFNAGVAVGYGGLSSACPTSAPALQSLDVVFLRPNTSTIMTGTLTSGPQIQADTACIKVIAPDGAGYRYVKITQLGQVSVTGTCP